MRLKNYAAAPGEHALRLSVTSTIFPLLPHRSRAQLRVGLILMLAVLATSALLRWQAPLIAISAVGTPLLFLIYLYQADVFVDLTRRTLVVTAAMGIGLGVGWALLTGRFVAAAYDVALSSGMSDVATIVQMQAIELAGVLVMLVPAAVARALAASTRESLDGYVIGALGALSFTAAMSVTLAAPQLATGLIARGPGVSTLIAQAAIGGVATPLLAVAAGGLFGVALWFVPSDPTARRWRAVARIGLPIVVVLALFAALNFTDLLPISYEEQLGLYLIGTALALLALRIGLQAALLYEAHDEPDPGALLRCPHCARTVPDLAFCGNCGVASRASSRSSRAASRRDRPDAGDALPEPTYPGRAISYRRFLLTYGAPLTVAVVAVAAVSVLVTPAAPRYVCPPDCGRPPFGEPVEINPRFTSTSGDFSVSYPGNSQAYKVRMGPNGVLLDFVAGDTGTLELVGEPARDRTPRQVADQLIKARYPGATTDYEIPNAMVGYQPGYGVVADEYPQDAAARHTRLRILVMVAEKNGLALIAAATGPYHEFSPDFGSGHPSGANLQLALDMAKYVNSFRWRGDPEG